MPNTVVPGFEQILGPALQGLVQSVGEVFKPNALFQKRMQEKLATDPELVVKLAGFEAKAPGTLAKMGFSDKQMSEIVPQESVGDQVTRTERPAVVGSAKAKIAANTTSDQLTADQNQAVLDAMKENPGLTRDGAIAQLKIPVVKTKAAEQATEIQGFELEREKKRQGLIVQRPEGPVDFVVQARKILGGTADDTTLSYINDPTTAPAMNEALAYVRQTQEIAARTTALSAAKTDTTAERTDAKHDQNAFTAFQKSGMAGDIDAWRGFMYDPAIQQRAKDLQSGKIKPANLADQNLLEVADAAEKVGLGRFNTNILAAQYSVTKGIKAITEGMPDEQRGPAIAQVNVQLSTLHTLNPGFPNVHAEWEDRSFANQGVVGAFTRDRIVYKDDKGKVVDSQKVEEAISQPAVQPALSPQASQILQRLSTVTDSATLQAALARMESDDPTNGKTVTAEVKAELKRMGAIK